MNERSWRHSLEKLAKNDKNSGKVVEKRMRDEQDEKNMVVQQRTGKEVKKILHKVYDLKAGKKRQN